MELVPQSIQGSTTHIASGNTIRLNQGELLLFGQGARQEILPAGADDIAVNFIILPQFFDKSLEMLEEDSLLRRFLVDCLGNAASGCLSFQVADVLPIQNRMENLLWTMERSICQSTMGLLFMQLMNHTDRLTQAAYLLKSTTLHVDAVADAVGYSNLSYFHRIFQQKYGVPRQNSEISPILEPLHHRTH